MHDVNDGVIAWNWNLSITLPLFVLVLWSFGVNFRDNLMIDFVPIMTMHCMAYFFGDDDSMHDHTTVHSKLA
ncbi:hypothetical protein VNO78_05738 [Psophocarpus tetragonolobus]|uniref:Uncharacterized protein n=1 Tax=Psophocarpus tetragonolobus TaxID=3891 RepID=A0AAN9SU93_PSOTE